MNYQNFMRSVGKIIFPLALVFCVCAEAPEFCGNSNNKYDPNTQFCFREEPYDKCGGQEFDPTTHGCVNNAPSLLYSVTVARSVGTGATGGGQYAQGQTVNINAGTAPSGMRFKEWTTESSGVDFANAANAETNFIMPGNAVTVTANFEEIPTYTVTVERNIGTGATGGGTYAQGSTVNISAGTTPSGHLFRSWTADPPVNFANPNSVTTNFIMPDNAVTVTANFEEMAAITFELVLSANPAEGGTVTPQETTIHNPNTVVSITATAADGYRFVNWTGEGVANADSANTTVSMTNNRTVTANFAPVVTTPVREFTVSFNTNGGTPATIAPIKVDSGATIGAARFPANPTKSGEIFVGWFDGETQYITSTPITKDVTLMAMWAPEGQQFEVSFNTDGGTPATIRSIIVDGGTPIGAERFPANPTRTAHIFGGWFDGDVQYDASTIITKNVTLKAEWTLDVPRGTVTDEAGRLYNTVTIGTQTWLAQNMNYETDSSWCYNNSIDSCAIYGRLYSWNSAMDACETLGGGWRLPDTNDWNVLFDAVGGRSTAARHLKAQTGWMDVCRPAGSGNHACDDTFGFSALPGSYRESWNGAFSSDNLGYNGYWWTATEYDTSFAWFQRMFSRAEGVFLSWEGGDKTRGYSVRCVRDRD